MTTEAFGKIDEIHEGLSEALAVAKGEAGPARVHHCDILERLRDPRWPHDLDAERKAAADEIARLRAHAEVRDTVIAEKDRKITKLTHDVERLRAKAGVLDGVPPLVKAQKERIVELEGEVERLKRFGA